MLLENTSSNKKCASFIGHMISNPHTSIIPLSHVPEQIYNTPCIIGIDEAGRGPMLGPLVYACFAVPSSHIDLLTTVYKVKDSKVLDPESRISFLRKIASLPPLYDGSSSETSHTSEMGWKISPISPATISEAMLRVPKYNLNRLSIDNVCKLIEAMSNQLKKIDHVYIDTIGPTEKLKKELQVKFPMLNFTVACEADRIYPVVSAASIIAKVFRDYEIAMWPHRNGLSDERGKVGSGYPNDPYSRAWVRLNIDNTKLHDPYAGLPSSLVRLSWSSIQNLINEVKKQGKPDKTTRTSRKKLSLVKI